MPILQQLGAASIDPDDTRLSRWLRARWITFGAGIALVEGTLVVAGAIPWWVAFLIACVLLFAYLSVNRSRLDPTSRIGLRILAFSQIFMLAVPLLMAIVTAAAIMALALLAVVALAMFFRRRR